MDALAQIYGDNPCERARVLRDAYYRLVSGAAESVVRYRGNEVEREVRFASTDLETLRAAWKEAEAACEAAMGVARPARVRTIRLNPHKGV